MITRTVKGKLLVFAVFSLGIATGGYGTYVYDRHTSADEIVQEKHDKDVGKLNAKQMKERFYDYLGVTPAQRVQLDKIYEEAREQTDKLASQTRPEFDKVRDQSRERIRAVLTEEQKQKYEEWRAKQRAKQQQERSQPPPSQSPEPRRN